jgi:hypothetical protein
MLNLALRTKHTGSHAMRPMLQSMWYVAGQGIKVSEPPADIRLNSATP